MVTAVHDRLRSGAVSGCGVRSTKSSGNSFFEQLEVAVALDFFGVAPDYRLGRLVMVVVAHGSTSFSLNATVESSGAERRILWCRSRSRGPGSMPSS